MNKSLLKTVAGLAAFGGAMISMDSAHAQLPPQHLLVIGALEFQPYDTVNTARDCNSTGAYCFMGGSTGGSLVATLPAAIPDAAVLRVLTCVVSDNSTTQNITARLIQHSWSASAPTSTTLGAVVTSGASTAYQVMANLGSSGGTLVLDRANFSYSVFIDLPVTGTAMKIQGCRAQYDI